jgi:sec-independent protein translocase protein TatC
MAEGSQMSFLQHLEELRWRLVKSAIAVIIGAVGIWFYQREIIESVFLSMAQDDFVTFRFLCETSRPRHGTEGELFRKQNSIFCCNAR